MNKIGKALFYLLMCCSVLLMLVTLASLLYNTSLWYLQALNFPRLQVLILLTVCFMMFLFVYPKKRKGFYGFLTAFLATMLIQAVIIFPYTALSSSKVKSISEDSTVSKRSFSIIVANVLMTNRNADSLVRIINNKHPDFVLTMEVNQWWVDHLSSLNSLYPQRISFPTDNTYGMCLYSKFPLSGTQVFILNHDSVPTFFTTVTLPDNTQFKLMTIHPVAPKPSEHPDNVGEEEVSLPKAAQLIAKDPLPTVVAGDFNDVGWSHNIQQFQKDNQLNDVRYGRGLYSTFNAQSSFFRWPLDYVFVSEQFKVIQLERLPAYGSDHFPYFVQLYFDK